MKLRKIIQNMPNGDEYYNLRCINVSGKEDDIQKKILIRIYIYIFFLFLDMGKRTYEKKM